MAVSERTIRMVYSVMIKHCTEKQIMSMLKDMMAVPGNQSFRDTVQMLVNHATQAAYKREG